MKYLIIDFNALFHRSRNALLRTGRTFTSPNGEPTTGIFSSVRTIFSLLKEYPDHSLVIATEGKNSLAKRRKEDENYKASRTGHSDDFYFELNTALELLSHIAPIVQLDEMEGDDAIAALVQSLGDADEALIFSCDRDLLPLVSERVRVLLFTTQKKKKVWDLQSVKEEYGGHSGKALYYLKMMTGDGSDEIPGIKGVGLKTAIKILNEVGLDSFERGEYNHPKLIGECGMLNRNRTLVFPHIVHVMTISSITVPLNLSSIEELNRGLEYLGIKKVKY
jgi:DNA polymerase-1